MSAPSLKIPVALDLDSLRQQGEQAAAHIDGLLDSIKSSFDAANDQIASSTTSGFSQVGAAVAGVTVGLTGAAAAGYALFAALSKVTAEVADIARGAQYLNTSTDNFQALRFAGQTAGVPQAQASKDLENVARLLNDAKVNENSLTKLLDENNVKYKDRNGQLISINDLLGKGANLVANAGSYADKVQIAKMLGLTEQWIPVLENGAAAFNQIADGAQAAGVIIDRETIAKAQLFDEAWRSSADRLSTEFKSAVVDVASFLSDLIDKAGAALQKLNDVKGFGDGQAKFDAIADATEILSRDTLGLAQNYDQVARAIENAKSKHFDQEIIDNLERIAAKAKAAADEINKIAGAAYQASGSPLPQARPAGAGVPANPTKLPVRDTSTDTDAFEGAQDRIKKRTAEYEAETKAVGLNTEAKTRLKAIADLNAAADKAGIPVLDQRRHAIEGLAAAEGAAAQTAADAAQKWKQQNDLIQFGGDQMISIMDGLRTKTMTAQQAVLQLTNAFINAAEKALLLGSGPLAGIFGTAASAGSGGTGGLLGALFGGFRAGGGSVSAGRAYVVGENQPEIFVPSTSGSIVPSMPSGGGAIVLQLTNQIDARGADQAAVDRLQLGLDKMQRALPTRIASEVHRQQVRGGRP